MESRTLEFVEAVREFRKTLQEEYDAHWDSVIDNLGGGKRALAMSLKSDWDEKLKSFQTDRFTEFLLELYFCPDREHYEEKVRIHDKETNLLLPPQKEVIDEIDDWSDADFSDADHRKTYIEETIADFTDEPWRGEEIDELAYQLGKRFD